MLLVCIGNFGKNVLYRGSKNCFAFLQEACLSLYGPTETNTNVLQENPYHGRYPRFACRKQRTFPECPSTQHLRTLVPKTIPLVMVFGTRVLKYWALGPAGFVEVLPRKTAFVSGQSVSWCIWTGMGHPARVGRSVSRLPKGFSLKAWRASSSAALCFHCVCLVLISP